MDYYGGQDACHIITLLIKLRDRVGGLGVGGHLVYRRVCNTKRIPYRKKGYRNKAVKDGVL